MDTLQKIAEDLAERAVADKERLNQFLEKNEIAFKANGHLEWKFGFFYLNLIDRYLHAHRADAKDRGFRKIFYLVERNFYRQAIRPLAQDHHAYAKAFAQAYNQSMGKWGSLKKIVSDQGEAVAGTVAWECASVLYALIPIN